MLLLNYMLVLSAYSDVIDFETWNCVHFIVEKYFKQNTRYLITAEKVHSTSKLWSKPLIRVTNSENRKLTMRLQGDVVLDSSIPISGVKGRTLMLVDELKEAERYRVLRPLVLRRRPKCCSVFIMGDNSTFVEIDQWSDGGFVKGSNLYPAVSYTHLNVLVGPWPPCLNNTGKATEGPARRAFSAVTDALHMSYTLIVDKMAFYGVLNRRTYPPYLHMLNNGTIDLTLACHRLTQEKFDNGEPLPLGGEGGVMWYVPAPRALPFTSALYNTFPDFIWYLILLSSIFFALFTKFAANLTFTTSIFKIIAVLLGQDYNLSFKFGWCEFVLLLFKQYSVFIIWFYQTMLLTFLFTRPYEKDIKDIEDAVNRGFSVVIRYNNGGILRAMNVWKKVSKSYKPLAESKMDYNLIFNRTAVFLGETTDNFLMQRMFPKRDSLAFVRVLYPPENVTPFYLYTAPSHPIYPKFLLKIYQLIDTGLINHWMSQEYERVAPRSGIIVDDDLPKLSFEHLQSVFYLYGIVTIAGTLSFLCELFSYQLRNKN